MVFFFERFLCRRKQVNRKKTVDDEQTQQARDMKLNTACFTSRIPGARQPAFDRGNIKYHRFLTGGELGMVPCYTFTFAEGFFTAPQAMTICFEMYKNVASHVYARRSRLLLCQAASKPYQRLSIRSTSLNTFRTDLVLKDRHRCAIIIITAKCDLPPFNLTSWTQFITKIFKFVSSCTTLWPSRTFIKNNSNHLRPHITPWTTAKRRASWHIILEKENAKGVTRRKEEEEEENRFY